MIWHFAQLFTYFAYATQHTPKLNVIIQSVTNQYQHTIKYKKYKITYNFKCLLLQLFIINESNAKPFLFSTSKWVYQRLFASNASADHSTRNIEDLSEEGPIFHHANKTHKVNNTLDSTESQVVDLTKNKSSKLDEEEEFDLDKNGWCIQSCL